MLWRGKSQFGRACWQVYGVRIYHIQIVSNNPALVYCCIGRSQSLQGSCMRIMIMHYTMSPSFEMWLSLRLLPTMKDSRFAAFLLPYPYQIYAGKFDLGGWQRALCLSPVVPLRWISSMYWWNLLCILLCWWYMLCILLLCCCIETCAQVIFIFASSKHIRF